MKYTYVASFRMSGALVSIPTWRVTEWAEKSQALDWIMRMFDTMGDEDGQVHNCVCDSVIMFNSESSTSIATLVTMPSVLP